MPNKPIDVSSLAHPTQHSRLIPGEERIRRNVFYQIPITGFPCGKVKTVYDIIRRGREESGDGPLYGEICNGDYVWLKYSEVIDQSVQFGSGLLALGRNTQRIGLAGIHSTRFMVALNSLVSFSIIAVPLYHNSKMDDLSYIIDSCGLEIVVADTVDRANGFIQRKMDQGDLKALKTIILIDGDLSGIVQSEEAGVEVMEWDDVMARGKLHLQPVRPPSVDDVYVICHTSGTTGRPKGVQTTHGNLVAAAAGLYCQWCPPPNNIIFDSADVYFSFLSLAHIYEHLMQSFILYVGGRVGIYSGDVTRLLPDIQLLKPTMISLVPRLLNKFYDAVHARMSAQPFLVRILFRFAKWYKLRLLSRGTIRFDTIADRVVFRKVQAMLGGRVRVLTTGGAPVSAEVKNFTRIAYGAVLFEGYGQTECGAAGTLNIPSDTTTGHVGGPAPWAEIKLIDADELGYFSREDRGEVCFRGAAVMRGYCGDGELTRKTVDEQGWLHTGDIGMWLPNGALAIIDRKNAFFKLAQGDFVAPELIENVYGQHPLIQQVFVAGRTTRSFLVAVAVVNLDALRTSLSNIEKLRPLINHSDRVLLDEKRVVDFILAEMRTFGREKGLTSIELPRKMHLTTQEFTAEAGFLTSTLKLRRHALTQHYAEVIDRLYQEVGSA